MTRLSICAMFRNEAPYLREWIEFHRIVGVDHFYLYQNNNSTDNWREVLEPYAGIVEVIDWPHPSPCQEAVLSHYLREHKDEPGWTAFIDCDEFLFAPQHSTLKDFLVEIPDQWGAIAANWLCFGSSGNNYWEDRPVIERFRFRRPDDFWVNHHVKSIVRNERVEKVVWGFPHIFQVRGGTFDEKGRSVNNSYTIDVTHEWLRINHYATKSQQEYMQRACCDTKKVHGSEEFVSLQSFEVEDKTILRYLPELRQRLSVYEGAVV